MIALILVSATAAAVVAANATVTSITGKVIASEEEGATKLTTALA